MQATNAAATYLVPLVAYVLVAAFFWEPKRDILNRQPEDEFPGEFGCMLQWFRNSL